MSGTPALIVLDLNLPDIDGIEVCRRIRKTARRADPHAHGARRGRRQDHRPRGRRRRLPHEAVQPARARGAREVGAPPRRRRTARSSRRRCSRTATSPSTPAAVRSRVGEEEVQLAPKEFDLLWELLDHRGLVLTRDQLLERVWGYTFAGDTRTVDVHVRQLRRKLGDASPIVTVWGVGYKVSPAREPAPARGNLGARACSALSASSFRRSSSRASSSSALVSAAIAFQLSSRTRSAAREPISGARRAGSTRAVREQASGVERRPSGAAARGGDRRPHLLRPLGRASSSSRERSPGSRLRQLPKRAIDFRPSPRAERVAVRVRAARRGARRGSPSRSRSSSARNGAVVLRRARRRKAEGPAARRASCRCSGGSRSRCSAASSWSLSLAVYLSRRLTRPVLDALARRRRGRAAATTRSRCRACRAAARSAIWPSASARWRARLGEAEQLERNFLMSVSHELRTPLTAIRGHVAALSEGLVEDAEARDVSLEIVAEETERLSRLVGDVLDLAKLDARRFTVLQEEVDMEQPRRARVHDLPRGGAAARDRLPQRAAGAAGAHHRRRSRPADHHEPAVERLPVDARRRPDRARADAGQRCVAVSVADTGPGDHGRGARADLPAVLVARRPRHRSRPRDRERARAGARRAHRARDRGRPRLDVRARAAANS